MDFNFDLDLRLFDGEGAGAPEADTSAQITEPQANDVAETQTHVTANTTEDRAAAFDELIKGEYKDAFNARAQKIIDARFKETKTLEARSAALAPVLEALSSKYGVNPEDVDGLRKAIDEDASYYEAEAERKGLTVDQLKTMKRMETENAKLRQAVEERERQENANRIYARWEQESAQCAQTYPDFSLENECRSPETGQRFVDMLKNGIDVKTAFEVIHKDELMGGAIRYAVAATQRRTVDSIRARGMRPAENGAGGTAAGQLLNKDVTKWTKADRENISRRVLRGESIPL